MSNKLANNIAAAKNKRKKYQAIKAVKEVPCMDCNGTFPSECMDFDHVRGEKSFNIMGTIHAHGMQTILDEIAKCEIVCSNCHRIRTVRRRQSGETDRHNRVISR